MLKETIKYVDYDGTEREEDFYFNLTKAEVIEMDMTTVGGMEKLLKTIIASKDTKRIMEVFKEILAKSYGVKSPDGRRFVKSPEIFNNFAQTEAYSELFLRIASDPDYAASFIRGILPAFEPIEDKAESTEIAKSDDVVTIK